MAQVTPEIITISYTQEEFRDLIKKAAEEYIKEHRILERLDLVAKGIEAYKKAFELIYKDPHQWSTRPCLTCSTISSLIGKPFGCNKV